MLRIHSILMRIRIRDSPWKKMDPDTTPDLDSGLKHFFKICWFFFSNGKFSSHFFLLFSLIFMLKNIEPLWGSFINLLLVDFYLCSESNIFGLGWYFAPWIRIFLRTGILNTVVTIITLYIVQSLWIPGVKCCTVQANHVAETKHT